VLGLPHAKRAGLVGRLVHDLQRTGFRNFIRAGIAEKIAMQLSGHVTRSVFERYNIVSERDLQETGTKLNKRYVPKTVCRQFEFVQPPSKITYKCTA
jgi:hypothetical protein